MIPDLADWVRQNDISSDEDDDKAFYWGEADDYNYCMSTESESDGDEGDRKGIPQVGTGMNGATILGDEKQKSEVPGTDGVSAKKSSKKMMSEGDAEPKLAANKATDGDASEEVTSTEMKEKRKLQEDGVKSEKNEVK